MCLARGTFAIAAANSARISIIDTDMQYAFTRPIADHMLKNSDGVLKLEGEVGRKEDYDPRSYLALAEAGMAGRVQQGVIDLRGNVKTMFTR